MYKKLKKPVRSKAFNKLMTKVLVKMGRGTKIEGPIEEMMYEYLKTSRAFTMELNIMAESIEKALNASWKQEYK